MAAVAAILDIVPNAFSYSESLYRPNTSLQA